MSDVPCFVGIDVAKAQLDIAVRPTQARWAVPNDAGGIITLVEQVQALSPNPDCAGSYGWPGAGRRGRVGHGWPARRRGQPAAGAGFCARHWPVGQYGLRWMPVRWRILLT